MEARYSEPATFDFRYKHDDRIKRNIEKESLWMTYIIILSKESQRCKLTTLYLSWVDLVLEIIDKNLIE